MIIEAVYCRDKKEFEYLEEIRETKLKLRRFEHIGENRFEKGITVLVIPGCEPSYLTGSRKFAEEWRWTDLNRRVTIGSLNDFVLELGISSADSISYDEEYLLLM